MDPAAPPHPHRLALTYLVAGAFFMEMLDSTVAVTAVPAMAQSLGVGLLDINVALSAYSLALAVLIPVSGWIADRYGARLVFAVAIVVFTVGSALCGISQSLPGLIGAEVLQACGGAMMVPVGRLLVLRVTDKRDLVAAITTITWPGLIAPVAGPPLGGFITTYFSWRGIFFLNVPLGVLALVCAWRIVPRDLVGRRRPFDAVGFVATALAVFAAMYALEAAGRGGFTWAGSAPWVALALAAGWFAVFHAARHPHPMLELGPLRHRTFSVAVLGGSVFRLAIGATPFVVPLMFQVGFGLDAVRSGLLVLAIFAGNIAMKLVTTPLLRRFRFRPVLLVSGSATALTIGACALFTAQTPLWVAAAVLFVSGMGRSMQFTALNTIAFADVPDEAKSGASSMTSLASQMAFGVGIALGATLVRMGGALHGDAPGAATPAAFRFTFVALGLIGLVALLDVLRLPADAGDNIRPAPAPVRGARS